MKNIGLLEIHGEHIGENGVSSELRCIVKIWELKLIVIMVFQYYKKKMKMFKLNWKNMLRLSILKLMLDFI